MALGPVAWGSAYVLLGAARIYEPIWQYDSKTLAEDFSVHLVFGVATATVYGTLSWPGNSSVRNAGRMTGVP